MSSVKNWALLQIIQFCSILARIHQFSMIWLSEKPGRWRKMRSADSHHIFAVRYPYPTDNRGNILFSIALFGFEYDHPPWFTPIMTLNTFIFRLTLTPHNSKAAACWNTISWYVIMWPIYKQMHTRINSVEVLFNIYSFGKIARILTMSIMAKVVILRQMFLNRSGRYG